MYRRSEKKQKIKNDYFISLVFYFIFFVFFFLKNRLHDKTFIMTIGRRIFIYVLKYQVFNSRKQGEREIEKGESKREGENGYNRIEQRNG